MAIKLKVYPSDGARLKSSDGIPIYPEPYEGSYTVSPSGEEQTLATNGLMMTDDVTVEAAPLQSKEVTSSVTAQEVEADEGYYGLDKVTVNAMAAATPKSINESTRPNTPTVDANGLVTATTTTVTGTIKPIQTAGYVDTDFGVPYTNTGGSSTLQLDTQAAKTVTPTESEQTAVAANKYTTGTVKVGAISNTYVGSAIPVNPSPTVNGKTVTIPTGYYSSQTTADVATGTAGTPTATKSAVSNHSVTVTPSVTNTTGYITGGTKTGTAVSVAASELVSGTKEITANGTGIDVTTYSTVDVAVPDPVPVLETVTKSYTPTESQQTETITPSTGYDGIGEVDVTVGAIASDYVGSGITRRDSTSLSASGATVTAPAGYYASSATKSVASGTEGTPTATKGAVSSHSISITPSVTNTAGYISGGTHTGTAVSVSASELVSGSETKTANGNYDVTNLAELVVQVPINNVTQDANGYIVLPPTGGGGGGGGGTLKIGAIRPDAELIKTYTYDKYAVADEGFTIPAYSTTAVTMIESTQLEQVDVDISSYHYFLALRGMSTPIYSTSNPVQGKVLYFLNFSAVELVVIPANAFSYGGVTRASATPYMIPTQTYLFPYFSTASVINYATGQLFGTYAYYASSPSYANQKITIYSPRFSIRGSSTYFTQSAWNEVTDIRNQYVIQLYRVPVGGTVKGYELTSQAISIVNDYNNNNGKLT